VGGTGAFGRGRERLPGVPGKDWKLGNRNLLNVKILGRINTMNEKNIAEETKKPYQKPEIVDHGTIEKITEQSLTDPLIKGAVGASQPA
jgi:hypothetical protein